MTQEASKQYNRVRQLSFYMGVVLDFAVLVLVCVSGFSVALRDFAYSFSYNLWIANGIFIFLFCLGLYLVHLPINLFIRFYWEHKFSLSNQSLGSWFKDEIKKNLLTFILLLFLIEVIYALLARFPDNWWIGAGSIWLIMSLFLARILPNYIIPMFYKYSDIENQELRQSIFELFEKCKVNLKGVYAINLSSKSKKANAFVCGLGDKRRVVLSDTLIENFSVSEIETVIAHELGHYCHRDIAKLIFVNTCIVFLGFYMIDLILETVSGWMRVELISDIALLPALTLAMMIFGFCTSPISNTFSRFLEVQADKFSIDLTKRPADFVSMIEKLGKMNMADFQPNRFEEVMFHDHPSISKRIVFAKSFIS